MAGTEQGSEPLIEPEDIPRYAMLDVWLALGGHSLTFEEWMADPKRTPADAWAQLLAAIRSVDGVEPTNA